MLHPLEKKVKSVSRLARGQLLLFAVSCVAVAAALAAFAAGLADYLFHFEDVGVRLILSVAVVAVVAGSVYWFVWPVLRLRRGDVQTAQRIERRFPQLGDRLSSSLAFLQQSTDDPTAGSPALRRAVVSEAAALTEDLDLSGAVDLRWGRWGVVIVLNLCRVLLLVCLIDPAMAGLAAVRLAMPWGGDEWPRRNDLAFVDAPQRIAVGSDFHAAVIDRNGRLPKNVSFQYWYDGDGSDRIRTEPMQLYDGRMVLRLDNVRRPFKFRAVGGDHENMPWRALAVVEPPRIESLELRLVPPAYTGWPETTSSDHAVRGLEGTRVGLTGRVSRVIASASLFLDGEDQPRAKATVAETGLEFTFSPTDENCWTLERSGNYWLELVDREGLRTGSETRWEVVAITDDAPNVALERPGPTTPITRQALVPLSLQVKDDLAIQTVELRYSLRQAGGQAVATTAPQSLGEPNSPDQKPAESSEEKPAPANSPEQNPREQRPAEQNIVLYQGAAKVPRAERPELDGAGDRRTIEYAWDLAQLSGLEPGAVLEFHVAATDYKPQSGQSTSRRLVIISQEDLEDRIARRRSSILARLNEVLQLQRETRTQTKSLEIQLAEVRRFGNHDIEQLQSAELNQRRVRDRLLSEGDSVQSEIEALLEEMENNRVDNAEVNRRMRELLAVVVGLGEQQIPQIENRLVAALKISRTALFEAENSCGGAAGEGSGDAPHDEAFAALIDAGQGQDEVILALESLLGELSQWDNYRRFSREFSHFRQDQQEVAARTDELRIATLGKEFDDITPAQRAELRKLSQRQMDLSRRFEKSLARMRQMRDELAEGDPLASETLGDTLDAARRLALGGQMHESGRAIDSNRLGQSLAMQQEVTQGLQELLDVLSNRREHELGRLVEQLRKAGEELEQLHKQQRELHEQIAKAAANSDPTERKQELMRLVKQQQQLAEQVDRLSRRLMRLQAEQSSKSLARGASQAGQAAEAAAKGDGQQALEDEQQAQQSLKRAREELARELAEAEQNLVREQLVRLEQEIQGVIARQQSLLDDTQRLDHLATDLEHLDRNQLQSLLDLARQQRQLGTDTGALGTRLTAAEAFQLGLRGAAREMLRAAAALDRHETGEPTQQMEIVARTRLEQLVAALAPEQEPPAGAQGAGQGGSQGQQSPAPRGAVTALAELKLLRLMQQEINRRTGEIEQQRITAGQLTPDLAQELIELATEQGRLADLMLNLSPATEENPEDNPDSLPSIVPDEKKEDAGSQRSSDRDLLDSLLPGSDENGRKDVDTDKQGVGGSEQGKGAEANDGGEKAVENRSDTENTDAKETP